MINVAEYIQVIMPQKLAANNIITAASVSLPKKDEEEREEVFLCLEEANEMLALFEGHQLQPLVLITLYYGLRRSEVLGLKWDAVDFEHDTISIRHTVVKNKTTVAKDKTKTRSSRRSYTLLPEVKQVLLRLQIQQELNEKIIGRSYQKNDYVFSGLIAACLDQIMLQSVSKESLQGLILKKCVFMIYGIPPPQ